jgi:hypothetical protein
VAGPGRQRSRHDTQTLIGKEGEAAMGKVILSEFVTLDGVIKGIVIFELEGAG